MLKYFVVDGICDKSFNYIPIYLEFRNADFDNDDLFFNLYNTMARHGFNLHPEALLIALEKGLFIIYLGGYDEIELNLRGQVFRYIQEMSDKYPLCKFIVTSRSVGHNNSFGNWTKFTTYEICPLNLEQSVSLVKN